MFAAIRREGAGYKNDDSCLRILHPLFSSPTRLPLFHSPNSHRVDAFSNFYLGQLEQRQLFELLVSLHIFIDCVLAPHANHGDCYLTTFACYTQQQLQWWRRSTIGTIHGYSITSVIRTRYPEVSPQ